ncbi:dynamin family protein [Actinomycetospora atypica]|uniref:Dynamin family protein n=1 Tax=Actinomycetospora atypica TaxID=1290095 RepID=A0ABV9YFL5_9PSEU
MADLAYAVAGAAAEDGQGELATGVWNELGRAGDRTASVVAVGEKKRGKSSLINALVGTPGLLPVDVDVATSVHVTVDHAPVPSARVYDGSAPEGRALGLHEVAEYAALDPATGRTRHEGVNQVEVFSPSPLLARGLTLIDTPGVGGLSAGHAAVTLATLDRADALLFVVSGHSELTASELSFLERATARISVVLFVLTQFDQAPEWRAVLARNLELLARHTPRHANAPWFVVNSQARADVERARSAGRPDVAERRLASSGLPTLDAALAGLAAEADALRLWNVVHRCAQVADALIVSASRRADSLTLDPGFAERVGREKAALAALHGQGASWRTVLGDALALADQHCRRTLNREVEDLRLQVTEQLDAMKGTKGLQQVIDGVPDRINGIWMTVTHQLIDEVDAAAEAVVSAVGASGVDLTELLPERPGRLDDLPDPSRRRPNQSFVEHGMMAMGLGSVVGSLVSVVATPLVGIPVGAAAIGLVARVRHSREGAARSQMAARQFLDRAAVRVQTEIPPAVQETLTSVKGLIIAHVSSHVDGRRTEIEAALAEHQRLLKAERDAVGRARKAADERLAHRRELRTQANAIWRRLAATPPAAPASGTPR